MSRARFQKGLLRPATGARPRGVPPVIVCRDLVKSYDGKLAVDHLNLQMAAGSCLGLLGPNGAGKTTTIEMLEGLQSPDQGEIQLFGIAWGSGRDSELRSRIGVQLQETVLADKLRVVEIVRLFRSFCPRGHTVEQALDWVGLRAEQREQYATLSGGQKQRVALATALVGAPDLLFLDEPTTGLDPRARQALWAVVERFREEGGSVLLTTHYMEEAAALCDTIALLDGGRLVAEGSPSELIENLGEVQFVEFESAAPVPVEALGQHPLVQDAAQRGRHIRLQIGGDLSALRGVLGALEQHGVSPIGLRTQRATLDDVFLQRTGRLLAAEDSSGASSEPAL